MTPNTPSKSLPWHNSDTRRMGGGSPPERECHSSSSNIWIGSLCRVVTSRDSDDQSGGHAHAMSRHTEHTAPSIRGMAFFFLAVYLSYGKNGNIEREYFGDNLCRKQTQNSAFFLVHCPDWLEYVVSKSCRSCYGKTLGRGHKLYLCFSSWDRFLKTIAQD
ncbi:hypothetical protein B0H34DRAFT_187581 [Crassisporium funariophilum]|nr:hypothetical protein B0H34DRAFT_187581 [Crassisporium funariophilum]